MPNSESVLRVAHVRYRGAFGLPFFWHHAVALLRDGPAPSVDPVAPALGPFNATAAEVFHWSAGSGAGGLISLDEAEITRITWAEFVQSGRQGNSHFGESIEVVEYPAAVVEA